MLVFCFLPGKKKSKKLGLPLQRRPGASEEHDTGKTQPASCNPANSFRNLPKSQSAIRQSLCPKGSVQTFCFLLSV